MLGMNRIQLMYSLKRLPKHTQIVDRVENELKRLSVHYILKIVITFSNMDERALKVHHPLNLFFSHYLNLWSVFTFPLSTWHLPKISILIFFLSLLSKMIFQSETFSLRGSKLRRSASHMKRYSNLNWFLSIYEILTQTFLFEIWSIRISVIC